MAKSIKELEQEIADLKAKLASGDARPLGFKKADKGGLSVTGINARFPVTLYGSQWVKLGREFYGLTDEEMASKSPGIKACKAQGVDMRSRREQTGS